jgi:hypothetical protein
MSMTARHLRNEVEYLPGSLSELLEVRADVMRAGYSRRIADGLCTWLLAKAAGEVDTTATNTRSRYRRILSELDGEPPNEPGSGRPPVILVPGVMSSSLAEVIDQEVAHHRRSVARLRSRHMRAVP